MNPSGSESSAILFPRSKSVSRILGAVKENSRWTTEWRSASIHIQIADASVGRLFRVDCWLGGYQQLGLQNWRTFYGIYYIEIHMIMSSIFWFTKAGNAVSKVITWWGVRERWRLLATCLFVTAMPPENTVSMILKLSRSMLCQRRTCYLTAEVTKGFLKEMSFCLFH